MKTLNFIIVLFALSGLLTFGFSDVSATNDGKGESKAEGCNNANNDKMKSKNKHCGGSGETGKFTDCDTDTSGGLDVGELRANGNTLDDGAITFIESTLKGNATNNNGVIDTQKELDAMNAVLCCVS